ncbi:MAG TPA: hypothetical protein VNM67_05545 [Thermoanaerobaculia bacterium]|jgi:hypothetical protein|nr:hypothetical protein [Thermoanaerobaculia bacterium]
MKKPVIAVFLFYLTTRVLAQEIDEAIISPRFEYGPAYMLNGAFSAYASGAVEGSYYYMLSTNGYLSGSPATALPNGECRYYDDVDKVQRAIREEVVGYRGNNTFAFFQSANPAFTRFRTVSPCFDGRSGEQTEQQHRTFAYGAGSTVVSAVKGKAYLTVNRTRIRKRPDSTSPYELSSTGAEWQTGDFDQIFIGAKETLSAAMNTPTSTSTLCRGQVNPPANETCTSAFVWKLTPLVRITDGLVDPVDGQTKTFSALPPLLAEINTATESLPIFSGIGSQGAVLFGFMEFGHICVAWDMAQTPPRCTQPGFPGRLAAVFLTDTSTTVRPSSARLHFKKGNSWIPMNADGTFPTVPDDLSGMIGLNSISDVKFNPINSTWNAWTDESIPTDATTAGCEDSFSPGRGRRLAFVNLATYVKTTFWPSRNESGRGNPIGHYVFSPTCNCLREFVFYSSTDYACYTLPAWQTSFTSLGSEVVVRRWLDGAPSQ